MSYCNELIRYARLICDQDLIDLSRKTLEELLSSFRNVYQKYEEFLSNCYHVMSANMYREYQGVFSIALLKLCVVIEEKFQGKEISDEYIRSIVEMFTPDEKRIIREFERFNGLDVNEEVLAEMIASKKGMIYELVKEALSKQYVDFENLINTWSRNLKISDAVRRGFINKYRRRFENIKEAFKILIDKNPSLLLRFFSEYEEAILSVVNIRRNFEDRMKEVYEKELRYYEEKLQNYEAKIEELNKKLSYLIDDILSGKIGKDELKSEIAKLNEHGEILFKNYQEILKKLEEITKELEKIKETLAGKAKELEEKAEKENMAWKEILNSEVYRIQRDIARFEENFKELNMKIEELSSKFESFKSKVNLANKISNGEIKGRGISCDEAAFLENTFIEKFIGKMNKLKLKILTPWGETTVEGWARPYYISESDEREELLPKNKAVVFKHRSKRFKVLGEERVVEVWAVYLSHIETLKNQGYDIQPATLDDLLRILNIIRIFEGRGLGKEFIVIGIASPTGWDDSVLEKVSKYPQIFENKVIILVDLHENKAIYPEKLSKTVPFLDELARLFLPESIAEQEFEAEQIIKNLCIEGLAGSGTPYFTFEELRKKAKGILELSRVLHRLEKEGKIWRIKIDKKLAYRCKEGGW
jgi:hypothetical protein